MPVPLTYPGVYIEEIPSGVRTLSGVATSVTAFVGRALRGPTNEPIIVNSFADYERTFGGLWLKSTMSFAVRDFFLNGGGQAIIVRVYNAETEAGAKPARAALTVGANLTLESRYEGAWGNVLKGKVESAATEKGATDVAARLGVTTNDLYHLTVVEGDLEKGTKEQHRFVTVVESIRRVDRVLASESKLVRWVGSWPGSTPTVTPDMADGKPVFATVAGGAAASDGLALTSATFIGEGTEAGKLGLYALEKADIFNLLCIPPYTSTGDVDGTVLTAAASYSLKRRAVFIIDAPSDWKSTADAAAGVDDFALGDGSKNSAIYFPRLMMPNPLRDNQVEAFAPCGAVAGTIARIDAQRGVWKAPAGLEASLAGVPQLSVPLTNDENGQLNPLGINCLRSMPGAGRIIWGARTLQGDDRLASEWKYLPVRRLALYLEESLYRGTQWVVFEPNDEPLWAQIRLNLGAFMHGLFRQGAFQGKSPAEAYFVRCDKDTTTQDDINRGIVNIHVGFAPLKPAEFVIIKMQQMAGKVGA